MARGDLFLACAALSTDPKRPAEGLALTLFQGFSGQAGVPRLRLFEPGAVDRSFDEAWLERLGRAACEQDEASLTFLLNSRVAREHRRLVRYLVEQVARDFA